MSNLFSGLPNSVSNYFNQKFQELIENVKQEAEIRNGIIEDAQNPGASETLFEGNDETSATLSEKIDSLEVSSTNSNNSAEPTAEVDPAKEAEIQAAIDAAKQKQEELTAKETERNEAQDDYLEKAKAYSEACNTVDAAKEAVNVAQTNFDNITAELTEAEAALAEMNDNIFEKAGNWITGLFSDDTAYKQAQANVEALREKQAQAQEALEKANDDLEKANTQKSEALAAAKSSKETRDGLVDDVEALQKELDELIAIAEALKNNEQVPEETPGAGLGDGTDVPVDGEQLVVDPTIPTDTEEPVQEVSPINTSEIEEYLNPSDTTLSDEELSARQNEVIKQFSDYEIQSALSMLGLGATSTSEEGISSLSTEEKTQLINKLIENYNFENIDYDQAEEEIQQTQTDVDQRRDMINKFDEFKEDGLTEHMEEIKEYFKGEGIELDLIDTKDMTPEQIIKHAAKILEVELVAQSYSKGGAMAKADTATVDEHRDAESGFTDAVLQISDVVNSSDVEFFNLSDQSNYELNMALLDRINSGEYIKTSTLEKQTSAVQNIQVTHTSHSKDNDDKYNQYSNAILDQLQQMISDEEGAEMNDHTFNSIKSQFDIKAAQSMEEAFEFLEDEARKYGIRQAIEQD